MATLPDGKPSTSASIHPVLQLMYEVVLPTVKSGLGRVMPLGMGHPNTDGVYSEVFPFGVHQHDGYEWLWVIDNPTHINLNGRIHQILPGDFCLIPPATPHAELYTQQTKAYRTLWCGYKEEALYCRICTYSPIGQIRPGPSRAVPAPAMIATLLPLLESETKTNQSHTDGIRQSLVSGLAHLMTRTLESADAVDQNVGLPGYTSRRVMVYLQQNFASDISLSQVAQAVSLSRAYMCEAFRRETGKTVGEALTALRLERAKLLLLEGRLSVKEVARAVGYNSPEHFTRVFQQHERIAPRRFGR